MQAFHTREGGLHGVERLSVEGRTQELVGLLHQLLRRKAARVCGRAADADQTLDLESDVQPGHPRCFVRRRLPLLVATRKRPSEDLDRVDLQRLSWMKKCGERHVWTNVKRLVQTVKYIPRSGRSVSTATAAAWISAGRALDEHLGGPDGQQSGVEDGYAHALGDLVCGHPDRDECQPGRTDDVRARARRGAVRRRRARRSSPPGPGCCTSRSRG